MKFGTKLISNTFQVDDQHLFFYCVCVCVCVQRLPLDSCALMPVKLLLDRSPVTPIRKIAVTITCAWTTPPVSTAAPSAASSRSTKITTTVDSVLPMSNPSPDGKCRSHSSLALIFSFLWNNTLQHVPYEPGTRWIQTKVHWSRWFNISYSSLQKSKTNRAYSD